MKAIIRNSMLFVSGIVIAVAFQNCGQPGALSEASSSLAKSDAPLVVDVVGEMENQLPPPTQADNEQHDQDEAHDDVEHVDYIKHDKRKDQQNCRNDQNDKRDDVVYDNDLENVLRDHSCQNNSRKVLICHYPRGNSDARHEICISRNALRAHINHSADSAHQDHLGACADHEDDEG